MCETLTCETNGSYDVSVSVGASPLDTTTILNGTVSRTYLQHVWISSSLEVCHYFLTTSLSCPVQGSPLMEDKQQIFNNKAAQIQQSDIWARWYTAYSNAKSQCGLQVTHAVNTLHLCSCLWMWVTRTQQSSTNLTQAYLLHGSIQLTRESIMYIEYQTTHFSDCHEAFQQQHCKHIFSITDRVSH